MEEDFANAVSGKGLTTKLLQKRIQMSIFKLSLHIIFQKVKLERKQTETNDFSQRGRNFFSFSTSFPSPIFFQTQKLFCLFCCSSACKRDFPALPYQFHSLRHFWDLLKHLRDLFCKFKLLLGAFMSL